MKSDTTVLVYLPRPVREHYQSVADEEGISLSSVVRRELIRAAPAKVVQAARRHS